MNEHELDQLLDSWEAPAPRPSLRERVRARFPRAERRSIVRPLGWALAIAGLSAALAVGMEQTGASPWNFQLGQLLEQLHNHLMEAVEVHRAAYTVGEIRGSDPKVYIDGQPGAAPQYGHSTRIEVEVPGEGIYAVSFHRGQLPGWSEGRMRDNVIEFEAGSRHVRIECNRSIAGSAGQPVYVRRDTR
jgi:hypothetical protein